MLQDTYKKSLLPIDKRLKNGDGLRELMQRVNKDNQLTEVISDITKLPKGSFFIVSTTGSCLTLHSSSAVVATQLRMMKKELLNQLEKNNLGNFQALKVQVRPMYQKKRIQHEALRKISTDNAALLKETAEHSSNPKLKAILMRLASHQRSKD